MNKTTDSKKGMNAWLRLLAFFLIPALFISAANHYLLQTDALSHYTLLEMTHRDDIELALVGSSVLGYNFNPEIITEETGMVTFNASIGMMGLPSAIETTKLLFEHNRPEYVALVLETYNLTESEENIQAQLRLSPFLKNPLTKLRYFFELVSQDGRWFDRLLLFKTLPVRSPADLLKTLDIRSDPRGYYERSDLDDGIVTYAGSGHVHVNLHPRWGNLLSETSILPHQASSQKGLYPYSKKKILEFIELCKAHGAKPFIVLSPDLTVHRIAEVGYMDKSIALADFCREQGIEFFDFSITKPEFMPFLDEYYYDIYHLCGEGADIFSRHFAEFITLYTSGQPVDHLFYASQQECLTNIDFITNVWITRDAQPDAEHFSAACNRGPNVTPEYAFILESADGKRTTLRDYSTDPHFTLPHNKKPSGGRMIVHAKPQGSPPDTRAVFYYVSL